jgi:hypothetical protein
MGSHVVYLDSVLEKALMDHYNEEFKKDKSVTPQRFC